MLKRQLKTYALPLITRLFSTPVLQPVPVFMERVGSALQSKSGGGYASIRQEVQGALNFIDSDCPTIIDVGANFGHWTSAMLNRLPKARLAIMIEPQKACENQLSKLISDRCILLQTLVSDREQVCDFWQNQNPEISSIHATEDEKSDSSPIKIISTTVDSIIRQHAIQHVDYMKIDVEGHELHVLDGAHQSLRDRRVAAFSFEIGPSNVKSRSFFADFWSLGRRYDYDVYRIGHDGIPIAILEYSYGLETFGGVANYVASVVRPKDFRVAR